MSRFPASLKAVLFDLDGTLIDTASEFIEVINTMCAEDGKAGLSEATIRAGVTNGSAGLVTLAYGVQESDAEFPALRQRLLDHYLNIVGSKARPFPGIEPLLMKLSQRGIRWGIATNKPRLYTEPLLEKLALSPPAATVTCPDDVSQSKPHPEALLLNCKELDCAPHEVIYIGDHQRDITAGRRAGMYTIAAAYGYVDKGEDPASWGADDLVNSSADLYPLIFSYLTH